jgi:hypothetical protein
MVNPVIVIRLLSEFFLKKISKISIFSLDNSIELFDT